MTISLQFHDVKYCSRPSRGLEISLIWQAAAHNRTDGQGRSRPLKCELPTAIKLQFPLWRFFSNFSSTPRLAVLSPSLQTWCTISAQSWPLLPLVVQMLNRLVWPRSHKGWCDQWYLQICKDFLLSRKGSRPPRILDARSCLAIQKIQIWSGFDWPPAPHPIKVTWFMGSLKITHLACSYSR